MAQARDELAAASIGEGGAMQLIGHPVRTAEGTIPAWAARQSSGRGSQRQPSMPYRTGPVTPAYRTGPVTPAYRTGPVRPASTTSAPANNEQGWSVPNPGPQRAGTNQPPSSRHRSEHNQNAALEWLRTAMANPQEHMMQLVIVGVLAAVAFLAVITVIFALVG